MIMRPPVVILDLKNEADANVTKNTTMVKFDRL